MLRRWVIMLTMAGWAISGLAKAEQTERTERTPPAATGQQCESVKERADALREQGKKAWDQNNYGQAVNILKQALALYRKLPGTYREQGLCLRTMGVALNAQYLHTAEDHVDEAIKLIKDALVIFRNLPLAKKDLADCLQDFGFIQYEQYHYIEAVDAYEEALAIYRQLPDSNDDQKGCLALLVSCVYGLQTSGHLQMHSGYFTEAQANYEAALAICQKTPGAEAKKVQAGCRECLGVLFENQNRFDEALTNYDAALNVCRQLEDTDFDQAKYLVMMAKCYEKLNHLDEATDSYERAVTIYAGLPNNEAEQAKCLSQISVLRIQQNRPDKAIEAMEQTLTILRKMPDQKSILAQFLECTGILYKDNRHYDKALERYAEALGIYRKILGTLKKQAECLMSIGEIDKNQKHDNEALEKYKEAYKAFRKVPATRMEQADCLSNMGMLLIELLRTVDSLPKFYRALNIYQTLPNTKDKQAACLRLLGMNLFVVRRMKDGIYYLSKAYKLYCTIDGSEKDQADCLYNMGLSLQALKQNKKALECYRKAVENFDKLKEPTKDQAVCYEEMGNIHTEQSRYDDALKCYRLALDTYLKFNNTEENQAQIMMRVGVNMKDKFPPDNKESIEWLTKALGIYRKLPNVDKNQAFCLVVIASSQNDTGQFQKAIETFNQSLNILDMIDKGQENTWRDTIKAKCQVGMGNSWYDLGLFQEALAKYEEAIRFCGSSAKLKLYLALSYQASAMCLEKLERNKEAKARTESALTFYGGQSHKKKDQNSKLQEIIIYLETLGMHDLSRGEISSLTDVYMPQLGYNLCLAAVKIATSKNCMSTTALNGLLESHREQWDELISNLPQMSEDEKRAFLNNIFFDPGLLYTLALKTGQGYAGLEGALLSKCVVEGALQQEREIFLRDATPELRQDYRDLIELRRQWATLNQENSRLQLQQAMKVLESEPNDFKTRDVAARRQRMTRLKDEITNREQALARQNLAFAQQMTLERVTTDSVQRALDGLSTPTVLVEYVKYLPVNFATGETSDTAHYAAFILRPHGGGAVGVPLGPAAPIEQALEQWRGIIEHIARNPQVPTPAQEDECLSQGLVLRRLVFDPLLAHLGYARRLLIAPDDKLHLLPFEALPALVNTSRVVQRRYLLDEGYAISYLSNGRELVRLAQSRDERTSASAALVLAGPDFNLPPAGQAEQISNLRQADARQLARLSAAEHPAPPAPPRPSEVVFAGAWQPPRFMATLRSVKINTETFKTLDNPPGSVNAFAGSISATLRRSGVFTADQVEVTTGPEALEWRLKHLGRRPRLLQILTHGVYEEPPSPPTDAPTSATAEQWGGLDNPLLHSLLALAGANGTVRGECLSTEQEKALEQAAGEPLDDGLLTAYEVAGLDLRGCELVALTACQSAQGATKAGRAVGGLRWAFLQAGARSLLASQWSVPDENSREQMQGFYGQWLSKEHPRGRYEAFRQSQVETLADARRQYGSGHPWLWAGFVYVGDPGETPVPVGPGGDRK